MSRQVFDARFSDEEACSHYLAEHRWPEGFVCPSCGTCRGWPLKRNRATWECAGCARQTSVTAGTVMHSSHLPLRTWFLAAHIITSQAPIPEAATLLGDLVHLLTDFRVIGRSLAPHRLRIDTDQDAGPALRDRMILHRPQHCIPPLHRRRQGFPSRSFSTTLSSIASASRRLSFAFSSSSCFSRFASDRSIPPYLAFNL